MDDLDDFALRVRRFVRDHLPDDIRAAARHNVPAPREHAERWHRLLDAHGWGAPNWPEADGGPGWSLTQYAVFLRECAMADCPRTDNIGLATIGPAIARFGTPAQRARFLPAIRTFDDYWALALSEPGAGSDLSALATRAEPAGDGWVLNGAKTWISHCHWANRLFVLARTRSDARRQAGLSAFLVDRDTPGVTVRPIVLLNGTVLHSEVFLDDVHVPADRMLGPRDEGWEIARRMLVEERLFLARLPECERDLARVAAMGARAGADGRRLRDEPWFERRVVELCMRFDGYSAAWWETVAHAQQGRDVALAASVHRLIGTVLLQDLNELQLEAAGEAGLAVDPDALAGVVSTCPVDPGRAETIHLHHLRYRGITLGGGTSEIQRGIVARALLEDGRVPLESPSPAAGPPVDAARRFADVVYGFERRRGIVASGGHDPAAWRDLAALGLFGALVPDAAGGSALEVETLAAVAAALGRALVVEPWSLSSAIAAVAHVHAADTLPSLIDGTRIVALACGLRGVRADPHATRPTAEPADAGWTLDAEFSPVWGGSVADELWVPVRLAARGAAVVRVDPRARSVTRRAFRTWDGRAACLVTLDAHRIAPGDVIASGADADRLVDDVLHRAALLESAEVVGAMQRALEITVEHLRTRRQFGRALADFQALQHRVADHYVRLFQLDAFVRAAARALDRGTADVPARVAAAKWAAARSGRQVGHDVLQLHGAIGLQDETPISHYARRLIASGARLGDAEIQVDRYRAAWHAGTAPNAARPADAEASA